MADVSKTVSIIFEAESLTATQKVDALATSMGNLESAADPTKIAESTTAIDNVGESSNTTDIAVGKLGEGLKKMAEDAGVPKEALTGLDSILLRMGVPITGTVAVAAAALVAFAIVAFKAGTDAGDFSTKLTNLKGSSEGVEDAMTFVKTAVDKLGISLADGLELYIDYLAKIDITPISAKAAEDAFIGISKAIKGQGGEFTDTQKALDFFIDAAADGEIDLAELELQINEIPGALRIFATALGVSIEDLKLLAEKGKLGKDEIEAFAKALREEDYGSVTPVKDAFNDLLTTLKSLALELGAEKGVAAGLWLVEKAIRGVTLIVTGGTSLITLFGGTIANIAYTLTNLDFAGFVTRQEEIVTQFNTDVELAKAKFLGLEDVAAGGEAQKGVSGYQNLADAIKATGDEADPAKPKVKALSDELDDSKTSNEDAAKAAKASADEIERQGKEARLAAEKAQEWQLKMEEIASNERIKFIEANVTLNVAQIEADTERIKAAFSSIDNTITETSDLIGELFGLFGNNDLSFSQLNLIKDQIEIQNKLQQDAADLQKLLTEAQIENLRAQTSNLLKGDALIKVDGAGLQPHLEAFMWEILKTIQVRVNQQGLSMLLGV